jgi:uncharacterized protein YodC (DUF2158 family)
MLMLTKQAAIAIAATLGVALSAQSAIPAHAGPAQSTAMQSHTTPLQTGDLVRLRSGGPMMTVKSLHDDQVICSWWNEEGNEYRSGSFPIAMVEGPVTPPSNDANLEKDERAADQYYRTHCPSGTLSLSGKFECAY